MDYEFDSYGSCFHRWKQTHGCNLRRSILPPNQVTWHAGLGTVGEYEVYARWTAHPNRASDASYRIQHEGGETEVTLNQQTAGGTWNYLGNFQLGPNSEIHLSDEANGYVIADAVQLVWVPPEETQALYYVHNDHLSTPQAVTDDNQTVRWRAQYAPFGEAEVIIDDIEMPIRFPGQYFDEESGLHYNYFRDYDPTLGRYIQSDPIGLQGGLNTYLYVSGNPILITDFFGLSETSRCAATDYNCAAGLPPDRRTPEERRRSDCNE